VLKSEQIDDNRAAHALEVVGNAMIEEAKKLRETHAPNLKSPEVAS
jgi:hypothetical protein